jgi:hypothetical protein
MAHSETVMEFMNQLVYATKHDIGGLMAHKKIWNEGPSAVNNSYKILVSETQAGRLEKGEGGYFKLTGMKGGHGEHSRLLTSALIGILKLNYPTKIFREHSIAEKGLRPDALVLIIRGNEGLCFVLEVCNNETPEYLQQKINTWNSWEEAKDYLSQLFETKIKAFDIVSELDSYLEEIKI